MVIISMHNRNGIVGPRPPRLKIFYFLVNIFMVSLLAVFCGCGVKGDPIPPATPPIIGRGEPAYRRAAEDFELEKNFEEGEDNGEEEGKKDQRP